MEFIELLVMALATWRLASLFVSEDGPFNLFRGFRSLLGVKHHDDGTVAQIPNNFFARMFTCLWCLSIWMAVAVYYLWMVAPVLIWIIALSTGAIIIERVRGG